MTQNTTLPKAMGKLYGIGLGPGDPELMTLKAARLIREAHVIAYPSLAGSTSFARAIAADFIAPSAREIDMQVPMTVERGPAQAAYDAGAEEIRAALAQGEDVVVLCEGDPLFYGSFMYLFARLKDEAEVEIIPGVTSVTACAAAAQRPLTARNEVLTVLPGPLPEETLKTRISESDSVAIMKVGRHLPKIRRVIDALGLTQDAQYIARATGVQEQVCALSEAPEKAPYFSMILIIKGADPWL